MIERVKFNKAIARARRESPSETAFHIAVVEDALAVAEARVERFAAVEQAARWLVSAGYKTSGEDVTVDREAFEALHASVKELDGRDVLGRFGGV